MPLLAGVVGIEVPPLGHMIGDVFRDPAPEAAGLGAALLRRMVAIAAPDGVPGLHLAVTHGNPPWPCTNGSVSGPPGDTRPS